VVPAQPGPLRSPQRGCPGFLCAAWALKVAHKSTDCPRVKSHRATKALSTTITERGPESTTNAERGPVPIKLIMGPGVVVHVCNSSYSRTLESRVLGQPEQS
jgi:hypothetical protein